MDDFNNTTSSGQNPEKNQRDLFGYQGNGWSQYQIFVLRQLDDHGKFLEKMSQKHNDTDLLIKLMQKEIEQNTKIISKMEDLCDKFVTKNKKDEERIGRLEKEKEFETRMESRSKVFWGTVGAVIMGVLSVIFQTLDKIFKFFQTP